MTDVQSWLGYEPTRRSGFACVLLWRHPPGATPATVAPALMAFRFPLARRQKSPTPAARVMTLGERRIGVMHSIV